MVMTMSLSNIFNKKKVFITGHTGFKGSWLTYWLMHLGAEITGYSLLPEKEGSLYSKLRLNTRINHITADIRDGEKLKRALLDCEPEFVFHLAAQSLVRRSYQDPILTFSTNMMGSLNILEAVRACPSVRSLVYITSDKCYLNKEWPWGYRENDELGGADPYSASKASAELIFKSYYLSFFKERSHFGCASVRAGNVIGGGDISDDRIVPDIIRAVNNAEPLALRYPEATRPWQHVLDPLHGYLKLAAEFYQGNTQINSGEAWNFGPPPHSIRTVNDLAQKLASIYGDLEIIREQPKNNVYESTLLHLSIDKAQSLLKWSPKYYFEQAVAKTAEWYRRVEDGEDPLKVTDEQIEEFVNV
jgi:CDP-glucose 4,6-dehydratase